MARRGPVRVGSPLARVPGGSTDPCSLTGALTSRRGCRRNRNDVARHQCRPREPRPPRRSTEAGCETSPPSIGEEIGGLGLVPARTMRATAAECLLPVTSQAIRKHLRDHGVGAGVAPEFMTKRNSELVGIRDGAPPTPSVPRLADGRSAATRGPRLAFASARVSQRGAVAGCTPKGDSGRCRRGCCSCACCSSSSVTSAPSCRRRGVLHRPGGGGHCLVPFPDSRFRTARFGRTRTRSSPRTARCSVSLTQVMSNVTRSWLDQPGRSSLRTTFSSSPNGGRAVAPIWSTSFCCPWSRCSTRRCSPR